MRKNQLSHYVAPLVTFLCFSSATSAFSQDYSFSLQGYFNPSCGGGFFEQVEKEGMPFQFEVELSIDLLMGEPVVRSSALWNPYGFGVSCIEPYGQDGLVRLTNLRQFDPEGKSHPYHIEFVGEIVGPMVQGRTYINFNSGAINSSAGVESYNTPGSPNWDRLFFSMAGGSYDYWNAEQYEFLPSETAKAIFKSGFTVTEATVADVDFDLTEAKENFGARGKTARALKNVASRLAGWGADTFDEYPKTVAQRIVADAAQPIPENTAALRRTIDDIKTLHNQLAKASGKEDILVATNTLNTDLQSFLQAVDEPDVKEEFWQIMLDPVTQSAREERDIIAVDITTKVTEIGENAEQIASTNQEEKPVNLKSEIRGFAAYIDGLAKGPYENGCGKASYKIPDVDADVDTGEISMNVTQHIPMCGNGDDVNRNSVFNFSVFDIVAYDVSGDILTLEFGGPNLAENYYTSRSYPDRFDEQYSELKILINLKEDVKMELFRKALDKIIAAG